MGHLLGSRKENTEDEYRLVSLTKFLDTIKKKNMMRREDFQGNYNEKFP